MATGTADENSTAAGGRLLGTNKLQAAVDSLANVVGKLTAVSSNLDRVGAGSTPSGQGANGGGWNSGSNWGMGRGNGGGPTMGGQPVSTGRAYDQYVLGGGQTKPGTGNGGRAPDRASQIGAAIGGGVVGAGASIIASGQSKMSDMVTMQTAAALATQTSTMPWRAASNQAFKNNYGAQSTADAAAAYLTTARTTGYTAGSTQNTAQWNYVRSASLVNPNISQTQAAQASASLWSGQSYNSLRSMGVNSIVGGVGQSPRQVAQQILQKIPGTSQIKTPEQLSAALDSPSGGINQTLNAWAASGMLGGQSADVVREEIRGILQAQTKGVGYTQYSSLMNSAANGNKSAKSQLGKMNIGNTSAQTLMTRAGSLRNQDATEVGGFTAGLSDATAMLDKFTNAMAGFMGASGAGSAVGFLGSFGGMTKSAAGGSGVMGFLGSILHIGSSAMSGMTSGAAGGANTQSQGGAGGGGGSSAAVATGTQGAGKTAAAAINIAQRYKGVPYKWGGNNPKSGFDCSGLMQYVFKQIGVNLPRTAREQQTVGKAVSITQVQPGDLLFIGSPAHHVAMYMGGGKIIEAPHTGEDVQVRSFSPGEWTGGARRILNQVGNVGSMPGNSQGTQANSQFGSLNSFGNAGDVGSYGSEADALAGLLGGMAGIGSTNVGGQPGGNSSSVSTAPATQPSVSGGNGASSNIALGQRLAAKRGWTGSNWNALKEMWTKESGWNNNAQNPSSTAYGIPQLLNGTWSGTGYKKSSDPSTQIMAGENYIASRYGDPSKAWSFWQQHHWYDKGAWQVDQDQDARIHKDEMIVPAQQARSLRDALSSGAGVTASGQGNSGGGLHLSFATNAISVVLQGTGADPATAATFGRQVVDAIMDDDRLQTIAAGT